MAPHSSAGLRAGALGVSAAVLMAWGCGHTEPFASPPYGSDAPFDPTPPQRLTYNDAADRYPSWLSDGSGLLYSSQQTTRLDADLCAALLPPTGGTQRELWCDVPSGGAETDAIESPVVGADGQLAFVGTSGTVGGLIPIRRGIAVADTLDPASAQMVRSFPYTPAGSTEQFTAEGVRWLDPTRVVYLGQQLAAQALCLGCPVDTLRSGQAVTILDLGAPGSLPVAVPGTATATGVAVGPSGDALLYTLAGDSRVYSFLLASGTVQVAHDFGAAGVVRDIQVVGSRMAAVVGGRVAVSGHPTLGSVQYDSGGVVHVVDLNSGEDVALDPTDRLYRRPALSPLGDRLAVEGYPVIITLIAPDSEDSPPIIDTTVGKSGDIYLFGAP